MFEGQGGPSVNRIVCTAVCESFSCPFNLRHDPSAGEWECSLPAERLAEVMTEVLAIISAPPLASAH